LTLLQVTFEEAELMTTKQRNIVTRLRKMKRALELIDESPEVPYGPAWSAVVAAHYAIEAAAQIIEAV